MHKTILQILTLVFVVTTYLLARRAEKRKAFGWSLFLYLLLSIFCIALLLRSVLS